MNYYTSDQHYGHGNIIGYCNRPFESTADMNDTMVTAHNAIVSPEDDVWMLGDFCFGNAEYIKRTATRLNGRIHIVLGNHDRRPNVLREVGWDVHRRIIIEEGGLRLFLHHKPLYDQTLWAGIAHYHFCGHVHERWQKAETNHRSDPAKQRIINVGVDVWGFVPRTLEELLA